MARLLDVALGSEDPRRFDPLLPPSRRAAFHAAIEQGARHFAGRTLWHVNSTAKGGGVAEMLAGLLPYARGAGVDTRWTVVQGDDDFFRVTKRIHNNLHGAAGDGGDLGDEERAVYEAAVAHDAEELCGRVRAGDVVVLHDPQTAALIPALRRCGVAVVWRCHVGLDTPNDLARRAWGFLLPYVREADAYVFSRRAFAWEGLDGSRTRVIAPSIDPFSPKNAEMDEAEAGAVLDAAGVVEDAGAGEPVAEIVHRADVHEEARLEPATPFVLQVSRWDRLKDPVGVLDGFVGHVAPHSDAHLVLAGPAVEGVSDDPEGHEVFSEVRDRWRRLAPEARERVHLACLPMVDEDENAVMVNALQRRAGVVVQKSLAEGFGLTVAEAMWKARPVVASDIGGIADQIEDGVSGLLLEDPGDLAGLGAAVRGLLDRPERARRMGEAARERVREEFLGARHLMQYGRLLGECLEALPDRRPRAGAAS